jgi:hypothetical protein
VGYGAIGASPFVLTSLRPDRNLLFRRTVAICVVVALSTLIGTLRYVSPMDAQRPYQVRTSTLTSILDWLGITRIDLRLGRCSHLRDPTPKAWSATTVQGRRGGCPPILAHLLQ